jgi:translation initiation factor 2B subunit (eIF-2B alpha/beta/delta family)
MLDNNIKFKEMQSHNDDLRIEMGRVVKNLSTTQDKKHKDLETQVKSLETLLKKKKQQYNLLLNDFSKIKEHLDGAIGNTTPLLEKLEEKDKEIANLANQNAKYRADIIEMRVGSWKKKKSLIVDEDQFVIKATDKATELKEIKSELGIKRE